MGGNGLLVSLYRDKVIGRQAPRLDQPSESTDVQYSMGPVREVRNVLRGPPYPKSEK